MIIKITNYPVGIHDIRFEKSIDELQLGDPFIDKLILDCKLDKSQHQIVLDCNLTTFVQFNCDRCNAEYSTDLMTEFSLVYIFEESDLNDEVTHVMYLSPTADKIDITSDVIDFANLVIPMKKLCNEDCMGLCPKCSTNLNLKSCDCESENINPAWEQLKKLKDKLN